MAALREQHPSLQLTLLCPLNEKEKVPYILRLPNEILLLIFHQLTTIKDASHLAQSCHQLYTMFNDRRNKVEILRSAATIPQQPNYSLDEAFSVVTRVPPIQWRIKGATPRSYMLISFDYGEVSDEMAASSMWDMSAIQRRNKTMRFPELLHEFLNQFQDINPRWGQWYERNTETLLSSAAQLQTDLLRESPNPSDLSSENTVIALALHCLLLVRDFGYVDGEILNLTEEELFDDGAPVVIQEPSYDAGRVLPVVEVNRAIWGERALRESPTPLSWIPPNTEGVNASKLGYDIEGGLDAMLTHILECLFRLLDSRDPRHWPTVLYGLVILILIRGCLTPLGRWLKTVRYAGSSLTPLNRDLSRYYYICTDGGSIISDRWDVGDYTAQVGLSRVAVDHARILHELWVNEGDGKWKEIEEGEGIDGFPGKLQFFANGCVDAMLHHQGI
ncbi:F-box protein [Aspergillus lucknowensis]|uniref:F-box domain-containing protein n=1 Tax=Aspergillus lucknowensis TaxID=176173 RepID=A0ABR4M3L9_9EURO